MRSGTTNMAKVVTTITITVENVPDEYLTEEQISRYKEETVKYIKDETDKGAIVTINVDITGEED
jgi:hypothetical protein